LSYHNLAHSLAIIVNSPAGLPARETTTRQERISTGVESRTIALERHDSQPLLTTLSRIANQLRIDP